MTKRATLLQGTLDLLILKALSTGELHGLGVSRRIEQMTGDTFAPQPGSLFPALHRLEEAGSTVDSRLQDVRYATCTLRRAPMFALTATLSLGIGIAGNAVVFSLADAYLFRQRPGIAKPDRLVEVGRVDSGKGGGFYGGDRFDTFSYPNYLEYRARQTVFE